MKLPKLESLSVEQKLKLLGAKDGCRTQDFDGLLPQITVTDGPCGVRYAKPDERGVWFSVPSIPYPCTATMANSWDREYACIAGECMAEDCIVQDLDVLLAPGVNIKRLPNCGRNFEYYSEDPFLAGTLAAKFIDGVQGKGIGTSLKHYCCNNAEYDRNYQSSEVDERTLREIYLPAFELALKSKPWTVMCSYNLLNGVWLSENKKMLSRLREEFGFDGAIISDWGAVHDPVKAVKAGINIEFPVNEQSYDKLKQAYDAGELTDAEIDAGVTRVFQLLQKNEQAKKLRKITKTTEERVALSQKMAEGGMVLLKNVEGILPLKGQKKIAVSGYFTDYVYGGGSSRVISGVEKPKLHDCLKELLPDAEIVYNQANSLPTTISNMKSAVQSAEEADVAIVTVGTGEKIESEDYDRTEITLPKVQEDLIKEVACVNLNTVVLVYAGSAIDMSNWIDLVKGVIFVGFGGSVVQRAVANVLTGKVNPSGKLSETFPLCIKDVPAVNMPFNSRTAIYSEGLDVGYRYFATHKVPTLFPFGFGLSYSKFEYSNLSVKKTGDYDFEVTVSVTNVSDIDGAEIVQLYVKDVVANAYRPALELKGFDKKTIKAGKTEKFTFVLDKRAFAFYSTTQDGWTVEAGKFDIMIGASCEDIRLFHRIEL